MSKPMTDPAGDAKEMTAGEEASIRATYERNPPDPSDPDSIDGVICRLLATLDAARAAARNAYTVGYANGSLDLREARALLGRCRRGYLGRLDGDVLKGPDYKLETDIDRFLGAAEGKKGT